MSKAEDRRAAQVFHAMAPLPRCDHQTRVYKQRWGCWERWSRCGCTARWQIAEPRTITIKVGRWPVNEKAIEQRNFCTLHYNRLFPASLRGGAVKL